MDLLGSRVKEYRERLMEASGRFGGVEICAVSKTVPVERINPAYEAGIRILGENRVQEVLEKKDGLNPGFSVELIGQLQTNKVAKVLPHVARIQSVDRENLLFEIDKRAQALGRVMPILIEVSPAGEEQKGGLDPEKLTDFVKLAANCPGVRVEGLMAVMPLVSDPEEVRPLFKQMRERFERLRDMQIPNTDIHTLSMGMSADCFVAAEEGSTLVRLGRALFGARN